MHGGCDVSRLDHERFCALWFSRNESETRASSPIRSGIAASMGELPLSWFLHLYDTVDEARFAYEQHIAAIASRRK